MLKNCNAKQPVQMLRSELALFVAKSSQESELINNGISNITQELCTYIGITPKHYTSGE